MSRSFLWRCPVGSFRRGEDAKECFDGALLGDPVEVSGGVTSMPPTYAVFDWLLGWQQWTSKSAL